MVIALGAALKFAMNEGLARWQLATGSPLLEGWFRHLGPALRIYFTVYLIVWGFIVAGGLNLAVIYVVGLIVFALVLALIYNWLCTKKEAELAGTVTENEGGGA